MAALLFCLPLSQWLKKRVERLPVQGQALSQVCSTVLNVGILFLSTALLVGQSYNPFLYFRY